MSFVKYLRAAVAALALGAFLVPTLDVGQAFAQAKQDAAVKKSSGSKDAKSAPAAKKVVKKKAAPKDTKKVAAKKPAAKKTPAKKQPV